MKPGRILVVGCLTVKFAMAAHTTSAGDCMAIYIRDSHNLPSIVLSRARFTTTQIFHDIGVSVHWAGFPNRAPREDCAAVEAQLDSDSHPTFRPGAMGYTWLCENNAAQVHLLTDRILHPAFSSQTLTWEGALLGHVLAHEIGHVLEGVPRHSQEGLTKQNWTAQELLAMAAKTLRFTRLDADLIHQGIWRRRKTGIGEPCGITQSMIETERGQAAVAFR